MDPETLLYFAGISNIVKDSFAKFFQETNLSTEAWFQRIKLKTVSRDRYAEFITRTVGTFPLFGTTRLAPIESSYVRIGLSSELERERYRIREVIEDGLKQQREGKPADPGREKKGKTILEVLESTQQGIALLGNAGSGKTTIFRHLALLLAKGQTIKGKRRLPLYFAARDLALKNQTKRPELNRHVMLNLFQHLIYFFCFQQTHLSSPSTGRGFQMRF